MKPHEEWLFKAEHDPASAIYLLSAPEPLYDIAIYHTQQCAEKSLKAFLTFKEKEIENTHNLKMLAEICSAIDNEFTNLIDDCIFLNPYATLYRYPQGDLMPSKDAVMSAIETSQKIKSFVNNKIKTELE